MKTFRLKLLEYNETLYIFVGLLFASVVASLLAFCTAFLVTYFGTIGLWINVIIVFLIIISEFVLNKGE